MSLEIKYLNEYIILMTHNYLKNHRKTMYEGSSIYMVYCTILVSQEVSLKQYNKQTIREKLKKQNKHTITISIYF